MNKLLMDLIEKLRLNSSSFENMTTDTQKFLFDFLEDEITLDDFQRWIFQSGELASLLPTLHQDLIQFDFEDKGASRVIKDKLRPYIDEKEFNIWRVKRLLAKIIEDKIDIVLATRKLRELYFDTGEKLIPRILAIGYESELDDLPTPDEYHLWNEKVLRQKLKKADKYKADIKRDAQACFATFLK